MTNTFERRVLTTTPAIERMSWKEKHRTLEELRDSITRKGERYASPAWHLQELTETQARVESGAEQPTVTAPWV